ncbi:MAG: hypothetical protein EB084_16160 [Proteobacteria bacterium]|nr:hypothetical protein [Pseudomonadota bacterium]
MGGGCERLVDATPPSRRHGVAEDRADEPQAVSQGSRHENADGAFHCSDQQQGAQQREEQQVHEGDEEQKRPRAVERRVAQPPDGEPAVEL